MSKNTEVRTTDGWVQITDIVPGDYLVCYDTERRRVGKVKVKSTSSRNFCGQLRVSDFTAGYREFYKASVVEKHEIFEGLVPEEAVGTHMTKNIKNKLYNVLTDRPLSTIMFVRHIHTYCGPTTRNVNYDQSVKVYTARIDDLVGGINGLVDPAQMEVDDDSRFETKATSGVFAHPNYYATRVAWA